MEEKETEIFNNVLELFMKNGIKSMTMDDIARNLGISKKTLYRFVSDKSDLVKKVMEQSMIEDRDIITQINSANMNAIDEHFEISKHVTERLSHIHPSIFYDMKKYYPQAWGVFEDHKASYIATWVEQNLKKGIQQGLYRDDLNVDIIRDLHMLQMDDMLQARLSSVKTYSFIKVYLETFRYHIRGIASEKGIQYLIEKIKKEKKQHR